MRLKAKEGTWWCPFCEEGFAANKRRTARRVIAKMESEQNGK